MSVEKAVISSLGPTFSGLASAFLPMRTAIDTPESGAVVETTTRRRVLPADPVPVDRKMPDFWDYIESLKPEDWEGPPGHTVYIYRMDPRSSNYGTGDSNIDKCSGFIEVRPGVNVPFNDRDEVQLAIREKHGGKAFRLLIKRGRERISEGKCSNDAPPKFVISSTPNSSNGNFGNSSAPSVQPADEYTTADVAKTAMHMVANQDAQAIAVGVNALQGAASVIERLTRVPVPVQPSESDQLMKQLMLAMLQKALNPPDPLDVINKILPLLNHGGGGADPLTNPLIAKIVETGLDRVINPPMAGPISSASAELVRALPTIANAAMEGVREWRLGAEAQLHTAEIMAGRVPPALPPGAAAPARLPTPQRAVNPTNPTNPTPEAQATMPGPPIEFIESKILEIFREPISADEAADETMAFLDRVDEKLLVQLASLGETGLMQLFQSRPILQQAVQNLPRLQEFIKAFLKYAAENASGAADPTPASVKPN